MKKIAHPDTHPRNKICAKFEPNELQSLQTKLARVFMLPIYLWLLVGGVCEKVEWTLKVAALSLVLQSIVLMLLVKKGCSWWTKEDVYAAMCMICGCCIDCDGNGRLLRFSYPVNSFRHSFVCILLMHSRKREKSI